MDKKFATQQKYFDLFTKDFLPNPTPKYHEVELKRGIKTVYIKDFPIESIKLKRSPYIVFIIFAKLLNFKFLGRWEKTLWEIPVLYKGIPFMLSHRKFGFQFTSFQKGANLTKLAKEAIKNIDNAIPFAEQLFQEEIKQKVIDGRISLSNEYRPIKERYDFFRRKAAAIYKKMNFPTPTGDALRDYEMLIMQNLLTPPEASFYTVAMLDAFFSLLEHSLVLIIPFLNHGFPENNNLEQFIGMNWKGKYQYVFSKSDPKTVAHQLNALIDIKEEYRNPISHGHFHKNGNSFNVHMENLGAIPMSLSKNRGNLSYGFKLPGDKEFKQICNVLDCFDDFIAKNKETKYGIQYIKTGFIVAFDKSSHEKYMDAMSSEKAFGNFLDYTSYQIESSANMDW